MCAPDTVLFGDIDHLRLEPGERVKRADVAPANMPCLCRDPEGGVETLHLTRDEQKWHLVIDGVQYGVSNHARRAIAEALDRLDALRACLTDLGERVAATGDGGDGR